MIRSCAVWVRLRVLATALLTLAAVLVGPATAAAARPAEDGRPAAEGHPPRAVRPVAGADVARAKSALAHVLAVSLADGRWARRVGAALAAGPLDPLELLDAPGAPAPAVRAAAQANRAILAAKGLPESTGSVLELRLADGSMAAAAARRGPRLVAVETDDDRAATVPAFDRTGRQHGLAARTLPNGAVAVLGIDERRALAAGLAVFRAELNRYGVATGRPAAGAAGPASGGFWATRLMSVRLSDDEEPWIKGDAEIYTIVSGVGVGGQPQVDIVQMPYLDTDGRTYHPGQILVDWSHFKYNAVDAVMMEEDDGTNYRALAQALAGALLAVLGQAEYVPMVGAILEAIPDSWWTDDPDYVDSWYLLTRQANEVRTGARGNGVATLAPYRVTTN